MQAKMRVDGYRTLSGWRSQLQRRLEYLSSNQQLTKHGRCLYGRSLQATLWLIESADAAALVDRLHGSASGSIIGLTEIRLFPEKIYEHPFRVSGQALSRTANFGFE